MTSVARDLGRSDALSRPAFEILRDIARGGIAGVLTGLLVAGIGGRLTMRLAALIVPESLGRFTENGNRIGDITAGGTLGLILFGLVVGLVIGAIWVLVSSWLPTGWTRGLWAAPITVVFGGIALISGSNPDFGVLKYHPLVVVVLLLLAASIGLVVAAFDRTLDRRLPRSGNGAVAVYAVLAIVGGIVTGPPILFGLSLGNEPHVLLGVALDTVAVATVVWWALRLRGRASPPPWLLVTARVSLVALVVVGMIDLIPHVRTALGAG